MPWRTDPSGVRGVFERCCLSAQGNPLLEVVTAGNRRILEREVFPTDDPEAVADWLWAFLDRNDPVQLRVVG